MDLDPTVWGPHYWFVLYTIALTYPLHPNDVAKKKYYDFVQNIPIFLPNTAIGTEFSKLLDKYPVTPYLDSRPSFLKWNHFIHNRINVTLGKSEISMADALEEYYDYYKPKNIKVKEDSRIKEKCIYMGLLVAILGCACYLYKK